MTARLEAWLDQEDARITAMVRRYGWSVEYIYSDGSGPAEYASIPFSYTVGLFGLGHPELLIFNVPPATACGVMNELGERIRQGENLVAGQLVTFDGWPHRIVPETVPNSYEIVLGAYRHYDRPPNLAIPVLQLTYDDRSGRFPWEPGYDPSATQPRPGSFKA
jgi:Domain of unknown function (DUF4262)